MPFTFAHPAIILPGKWLSKRLCSITGLVIGSIIPDFEYFLRMTEKSFYSHTLRGLFIFDLPAGIIVAFLYHNIVRNPLISHLPDFLKKRFADAMHFDWNKRFKSSWLVVCLSILAGATSHLFWDNFTHVRGFFVLKFPVLSSPICLGNYHLKLYHFLQYFSSVAGLAVIALVMYFIPKTSKNWSWPEDYFWASISRITLIIILIRSFFGFSQPLYGDFTVCLISGFLISLTIVSAMKAKWLI